MSDGIVISGVALALAESGCQSVVKHGTGAAFEGFGIRRLDRDAFDRGIKVDRARHTPVSFRMAGLVADVLRGAKLNRDAVCGPGTGIISGSQYGCSIVYEMHRRLRDFGRRSIDAIVFAQATHSYPVSACAIEYGLQGPCAAVVGSRTAGMEALLCARDWLVEGRCDRVIVAAYEDLDGPVPDHIRASIGQAGRDVLECMALLCVERSDVALSRRAPVLAELGVIEHLRGDISETEFDLCGGDVLGAVGIADLALMTAGTDAAEAPASVTIRAIDQETGGLATTIQLLRRREAA